MKSTIKKLFCISLAFALSLSVSLKAFAAAPETEQKAAALKQLGLFMGVSETDFALDREPTRVEAIVMLIRALGKSTQAQSCAAAQPFNDVPEWAEKYIAYAYENGLTKGVSETSFGTGNADEAMYLTFMLRALGYDDAKGDFLWNAPQTLASAVGILPEKVSTGAFLRSDVVLVSWAALDAELKGGGKTLAQKLTAEGTFTADAYSKAASGLMETQPSAVTVSSFEELKQAIAGGKAKLITVSSAGTPIVVTEELQIPRGVRVIVGRGCDFYVQGTLKNNGTLQISGANSITDDFINYAVMAVQKGGTVINNGRLVLEAATLSDTMDRGPVGGQLRVFDGTLENNGSVFLKAGAVNTHGGMVAVIEGPFKNNAGAVVIVDGFQVDIAGSFINSSGAVVINNSTVSTEKGGSLTGGGLLTGYAAT